MRIILVLLIFFFCLTASTIAAPSDPGKLILTAVGDINFDEELGRQILKNPDYPWKNVIHILQNTDLLLGNLEAPLSLKGTKWLQKKYYLHADPRTVAALNSAGFDYLSLANNHIMDFGTPALQESLSVLEANKMTYSGAGLTEDAALKPAFLNLGSLKAAVLSFNLIYPIEYKASKNKPGLAWGYTQTILSAIKNARPVADLVIIAIHWGGDYIPDVADWQVKLAHACIDSGADVIIGHHPHIVLPVEIYKSKPILYSVGNFAFGSGNPKAKGAIFQLIYHEAGPIEAIHVYPLNVNNCEVYYQMQLLKGAAAEKTIDSLRKMSKPFGTQILFEEDKGVIRVFGNAY